MYRKLAIGRLQLTHPRRDWRVRVCRIRSRRSDHHRGGVGRCRRSGHAPSRCNRVSLVLLCNTLYDLDVPLNVGVILASVL